jgi:transposase
LELKQDIKKSPGEFGYEFVNWTGKSMAYHINLRWGIILSTRSTIELFHRLNLTLLRPRYKPAKGDPEKQARFKAAIQKFADQLGPEDYLLFLDEASIKWSATLCRMWTEKGHQPIIKQIGGKKGIHLIGVVDPRADHGLFAFITSLKAPQFIEFLESLLKKYPTGKIYVVLDNARVHHAKVVQKYVIEEKRLALMFLPPYSAELNPIERFWEYLRHEKTHNAFYPKYDEFEASIKQFIEKFDAPQGIIKSVCGFYENELETMKCT